MPNHRRALMIGDAQVSILIDEDSFELPLTRIFPSAKTDRLIGVDWLTPTHFDLEREMVKLGMHSFLIRHHGLNVLVDTCIGAQKERPMHAGWHRRSSTSVIDDLAASGVAPEDVDLVFCTHLHADHIGWNTRLENGRWVPTFPKARYAMSSVEMRCWADIAAKSEEPVNHGAYADSVLPVIAAGLAMPVEPGDELLRGCLLKALPGHTPGSLGLELTSRGDRALFCGDFIHSPIQLVEPRWWSAFCDDAERAVATRVDMLAYVAEENLLLCPAHFRRDYGVKIRRAGSSYVPASTMWSAM